ncbi:hypothetical protein J2S44_007214 [Catenuloplanes niger]|uniref:Uncharacterized protein n=1 Tax=Catenuloplanes niger TaxID=587534 RepID=A0AAE3ZXG2_9ACTN|nr:hypothetical protein [Catenuloplanes niger]
MVRGRFKGVWCNSETFIVGQSPPASPGMITCLDVAFAFRNPQRRLLILRVAAASQGIRSLA